MAKTERLATNVDEETKRAFRVEAAKRDMDMSELLRNLVHDFLDEESEAGNGTRRTATAD